MEWNTSKSMDATIHQFRIAVLTANVRVIKQILRDMHNVTPVSSPSHLQQEGF